MKKLILVLCSVFVAASAFAHIEPGVWKGVNPTTGKECTLEAYEQTFEDQFHHPLNERIRVLVNDDEFKVYHPRTVDAKKGMVSFDHGYFEGVLATREGSNALVIEMVHTKEFEGPRSYRWMQDNWKTNEVKTLTCENLKHVANFR